MNSLFRSDQFWQIRRNVAGILVVGIFLMVTILVVLHLRDAEEARATNPYFRFLGIVEGTIKKPKMLGSQPQQERNLWRESKYLARMSYVNNSDEPMSFTGRRRGNMFEVTILHQYFEYRQVSWLVPRRWQGRPKILAIGTPLIEDDETVWIAPQDGIILLVPLDRLLMKLCYTTDVEVRMLLYFPPYGANSISLPFRFPENLKSEGLKGPCSDVSP
jgi:hypothetical protein